MSSTRDTYDVQPIGYLRSTLRDVNEAPKQGSEGERPVDGTPVADVKIALDGQ